MYIYPIAILLKLNLQHILEDIPEIILQQGHGYSSVDHLKYGVPFFMVLQDTFLHINLNHLLLNIYNFFEKKVTIHYSKGTPV